MSIGCAYAAGIWTDLKSARVPNALVIFTLLVSCILILTADGLSGLISGLISFTFAFAIVLPIYFFKILAGGDYKLFLATSIVLPWQQVGQLLIASLIWGAIYSIVFSFINGTYKNVFLHLKLIFLRMNPPHSKMQKIPFTVALFLGWLTHLTIINSGGLWI